MSGIALKRSIAVPSDDTLKPTIPVSRDKLEQLHTLAGNLPDGMRYQPMSEASDSAGMRGTS